MLNLYYGATGTGKSAAMMDRIREEAELIRASGESRGICVIVPDQFTFEYERMLYNSMGCALFNSGNTEVWSFSRLVKDIFSKTRSPENAPADSTVKTAVMYREIKNALNNEGLMYFRKQASHPQFTAAALTMISELIHSGITPEIMGELAGKAPENMREKLTDIFIIYSRYSKALEALGMRDSKLDLRAAAEYAREFGYFKGMTLFMDEFKSFTGDQYGMIEAMLSDCAGLTVCLTADRLDASGYSPFTAVSKTAARLMTIAKKCCVKTDTKQFTENNRFKSEGLFFLSRNLMHVRSEANAVSGEAVTAAYSPDFYGECDYVCAEIKRLISEDSSLRYRDIAVLDRSMNEDISILAPYFERYSIPYYSDKKQSAAHKRLMIMINAALELAASRKISTEALLRYAKTGLVKPPAEESGEPVYTLEPDSEIMRLENYCYTWDIDGELWEKPFPETCEADKGIDDIRIRLLTPLLDLRKNCRDKTGTEICAVVRSFMAAIPAEDNLLNFTLTGKGSSISQDFDEKLEKRENERLLSQLDNILTGLETALTDKISLTEFREIFTLSASEITLSKPPEALDAVSAQQSDLARLSNPRIVFVMHANDGTFPYVTSESVTFSEREREFFRHNDHDLSGDIKNRIDEERFNAYKALCSPSERLYITCSSYSSNGSPLYPSSLIREIHGLLDRVNTVNISDLDMLFFCRTKESAYTAAVSGFDVKSPDFAAVRRELSKDPVYKSRFEYIDSVDTGTEHRINDKELTSSLYGAYPKISPSRFEDFSKCPFMFFCKKGLGIYPLKKNDLNPMIRGNLIHKCMQDIFTANSKEKFIRLSEIEIRESFDRSAEEFIQTELGGGFAKKSSFDFYLDIARELIIKVILHIQKELSLSEFIPAAYELPIKISLRNNDDAPFTKADFIKETDGSISEMLMSRSESVIRTDGGSDVDFIGTADRVDFYIDESGKIYLRIIDYKTGAKEFKRGQLDLGINMQMFFYLWALTRAESGDEAAPLPAGVLYMPMKAPKLSQKKRDDSSDGAQAEMDSFRMKGEILGEEKLLSAMQTNLSECESDKELYIPAKLKSKDGEQSFSEVYSAEELYEDISKAETMLCGLAAALTDGKIPASPLENKKLKCSLPCDFCDYREICGNYPSPKTRSGSILNNDPNSNEKELTDNGT